MKKITVVLFFFLAIANASFAQTPDTLKPITTYDIFPVGGLRYPVADTLQHMLGMNFNWWGFGGGGTNLKMGIEAQPDNDTSYSIYDPFEHDTTVSRVYKDPLNILYSAAYAMDARVYMPGTSGTTKEYTYVWNSRSGGLLTSSPEWIIRGDTAALGYVLSDLGSASSEPYTPGGWGQPTLDTNHIGSFSYELVYFFNSSDTASVSGTDPLYSIEYWIKKADDTGYVFKVADTITKNSYKALSIAITPAAGHPIIANSENLATWNGQSSHFYKIQKRILNIRPYYEDRGTPGADGYVPLGNSPQVDVRVRNFKKIPIFVRLLRIRDWVGQRLLTGKADAYLDYAINDLKGYDKNDSLKSWTIANEVNYRSFHGWCYLNERVTVNQAPPINVLAPYDYDLFQRVMHDQIAYSNNSYARSAKLWHEWTPFSGESWRAAWGRDGSGHPQRVFSYQEYQSYPFTPMPYPFAISGDTIKPFQRGISIIQNYDNYTYHWQNEIIGYNSESLGGGNGDCQSQFLKAQACYLFDPAHPQPYLLMAQANPYRFSVAKWAQGDSLLYGLIYDAAFDSLKALGKSDNEAGTIAGIAAVKMKTLFITLRL